MLGDHLGSASLVYDGSETIRQGYKAWGKRRFILSGENLPTTFRYTGQREEASIGLYYYGARWYDASLSRWNQPDTIIPEAQQGVQAWDRYTYVNNNPLVFIDPNGHCGLESIEEVSNCEEPIAASYESQRFTKISDLGLMGHFYKPYPPKGKNKYPPIIYSFNFTAGFNETWVTKGWDIIFTKNQIGFFTVRSNSPGISGTSFGGPNFRGDKFNIKNFSFAFPQWGFSLLEGPIRATNKKTIISNYEGFSQNSGGSILLLSGEYFESVDPITGSPNNKYLVFLLVLVKILHLLKPILTSHMQRIKKEYLFS